MTYTSGTLVRPVPPTPSPLITQWVMTVIAALGTGVGLRQALGPTLAALVGGSAGVFASYLVDWIRVWAYDGVDITAKKTGFLGNVGKWLSYWLYNPKGIRGTVLLTTLLVGAVAAAGVDWLSGKPMSMAVASAWAFIGSQVAHLRSLPSQPATLPNQTQEPANLKGNIQVLRERLQAAEGGSSEYYGLLAALFEAEKQITSTKSATVEATERTEATEAHAEDSEGHEGDTIDPSTIKVVAVSEPFGTYLEANTIIDPRIEQEKPASPNSETGSLPQEPKPTNSID